jgi:hypothetical protein
MDKLSAEGKATVGMLVRNSLAKLKEVADNALTLAGVSEKIRPVLNDIMSKLNALAA